MAEAEQVGSCEDLLHTFEKLFAYRYQLTSCVACFIQVCQVCSFFWVTMTHSLQYCSWFLTVSRQFDLWGFHLLWTIHSNGILTHAETFFEGTTIPLILLSWEMVFDAGQVNFYIPEIHYIYFYFYHSRTRGDFCAPCLC